MIKMNIEEPAGVERVAWPISQGVPFPDKTLRRGAPVHLADSAGNGIPTQARCLATWDRDGEYVKWLLLDFLADTKPHQSSNVFLEYGPDTQPVPPPDPVKVREEGQAVLVSTGNLELELVRDTPDFFSAARVKSEDGWRNLFGAGSKPFLYMTDGNGITYESRGCAPKPVITVEDKGPVRASVCIKGYHASRDLRRFCPYILRIHAYAGKSFLRFFHTFVFDQDPESVRISAMGMKFPLDLGNVIRGAFGGERGVHDLGQIGEARFVQLSHQYSVELDGNTAFQGERSQGEASLTGERGSVVAVLRDMWKEYPKGIAIDPAGLDIQLWPHGHEPLSFARIWKENAIRFDGSIDEEEFVRRLGERPTAGLNLKSTGIGDNYSGMSDIEAVRKVWEMVRRHAHDRPACFCDTDVSHAYGVAKTHEFVLELSAESSDEDRPEGLAEWIQEPLIAPAEPAYMCSTGALRLIHPRDDKRFPEHEEGLETMYQKLVVEPQETCGIYGMINYGEMINGHTRGNTFAYRLFRDNSELCPDPVEVLGVFNNEAQDVIYQLWTYFLRTGERKCFLFAEAKSEHVADVDIIHFHPSSPETVGLMHYHNVTNWSGGPSPSHTMISGFMLHYYLTGNRRSLEVAREVADCHVRKQEPCGVISNRNDALHREFTGPLMSLLEMYQATWEEKYGDVVRRSLDWLRGAVQPTGNLPISIYTGGDRGDEVWAEGLDNMRDYPGGMLCHILHDALSMFGYDWIRNWILKLADNTIYEIPCDRYLHTEAIPALDPGRPFTTSVRYKVDDDWYWGGWDPNCSLDPIVSLAFHLTKDLKYAAYLKHRLDIFPERAAESCNFAGREAFNSIHADGYTIPSIMSAVAITTPQSLASAVDEWREERARRNNPVFEGSRNRFDEDGNVIGTPDNLRFPTRDQTRHCLVGK